MDRLANHPIYHFWQTIFLFLFAGGPVSILVPGPGLALNGPGVAYHLGVVGKPSYSDGELVKRYLMDVVKCIHPGKEADYSSLALSRNTIQRRKNDIAKQLYLYLQTKVNKKQVYFFWLWTNRLTLRTLRSY